MQIVVLLNKMYLKAAAVLPYIDYRRNGVHFDAFL